MAPRRVPHHGFGRGEGASTKGKTSTTSPWPPALGEDEDDAPPVFFNEGVSGLALGRVGGLKLGCRGGLWRAGRVQVVFLLSSFSSLFSVLYFYFEFRSELIFLSCRYL
jgi:hypothetical protein